MKTLLSVFSLLSVVGLAFPAIAADQVTVDSVDNKDYELINFENSSVNSTTIAQLCVPPIKCPR